MDYSLPGSSVHGIFQQEYWGGLPFPSPGDLPDPGIELRSPALQEDSLPSEPLGFGQMYDDLWSSHMALMVMNPPVSAGDVRLRFDSWVRKITWGRLWQSTLIFLPGESHGQRRNLVSYGP